MLCVLCIAPAQEEHFIPDANLRAVVEKILREEIGLPKDISLEKEHMTLLVNIIADNRNIRSLQGLEFAINLEELDVYKNQIQDIRPLSNLPELRRLVLWHNQVSDISPLASITTLTDLNISRNPISDLRPVSKLIELRIVKAWSCQITGVSPISGLINIRELHLANNFITDVSPLVNLTQLKVLDIRDNPIVDFSVLQHLNITEYAYDPICDQTIEFPAPLIEKRVTTRTYPSVFQAWNDPLIEGLGECELRSNDNIVAYYDLIFDNLNPYFHAKIRHRNSLWYGLATQITGDFDIAVDSHNHRLNINPNHLHLISDGFWED